MTRGRFRVTGRVQGVGFRWWTVQQARRLGVRGWVRNRVDGSVEGEAAGSPEGLEAFREFLREGPAGARVEVVEWTPGGEWVPGEGFQLRQDG